MTSQAATILLNDVEARRVKDITTGGTGNTGDVNELNVLDIGGYSNSERTIPVFVFQMIGKLPSHTVTTADFTVTQSLPLGTPPSFDVVAHVIRTAATSTILNEDWQTAGTQLMSNFDNNNFAGTVSLNNAAEMTLGTYLNTNWVEGNYVFIALKPNPNPITTLPNLLRYGSSGPTWTASSTDAQLNITTIPEPSAALLGGLGALCLLRRRRA